MVGEKYDLFNRKKGEIERRKVKNGG